MMPWLRRVVTGTYPCRGGRVEGAHLGIVGPASVDYARHEFRASRRPAYLSRYLAQGEYQLTMQSMTDQTTNKKRPRGRQEA